VHGRLPGAEEQRERDGEEEARGRHGVRAGEAGSGVGAKWESAAPPQSPRLSSPGAKPEEKAKEELGVAPAAVGRKSGDAGEEDTSALVGRPRPADSCLVLKGQWHSAN
jgi:hypothetical protein